MSERRDGDWHLGYSPYDNYPGAALDFGRESTGIYCLSEPDITFSDMDLADADLPGEDGIRMGRDYQRNMTVTFELGVDGVDGPIDLHAPMRPWSRGSRVGDWNPVEAVMAAHQKRDQGPYQWASDGLDMLRQVWRADSIRGKAGRVSWLLHTTAGRTRQLYGRPRKFAVAHSRLTKQGYTPVVCEFVAVDDRFYDQTEKSIELYDRQFMTLPPRPGRWMPGIGWQSKKSAGIQQLGKMNTYPYIEIHGPCKNPKLTLGNLWAVQLSMTIANGEHVTIDARPWVRTVTHYKGSTTKSVADKLTRSSPRLSKMFLPPGYWTASMSYTNTAVNSFEGPRVRMAWRDAYAWW
ncbi:hypothetical protein [Streptomyces cahuitamycinicus]|uniref:Uncharacterized protein n=1 Tax=Streptomyces cahuitamycinicus TaxID=2070367 RepID=A0A2N8TTW2_9ACTN|nr:hypothetical protein [Streptomyces cahuitamycinicus]PNG22423.1 hypothetical protein C1J00_09465 [Streptomyces cahuitamycinicus]